MANQAEQRLDRALDGFLAAFRDLDWDPFIAAFAAEATVFFPFPDKPRRADGIGEIKAGFAPFFESGRDRQPAGPTYLLLDPIDLKIKIDHRLALVSFHLHDAVEGQAILCRRTFIWIDDGRRWRILHLHASNLPVDTARQQT